MQWFHFAVLFSLFIFGEADSMDDREFGPFKLGHFLSVQQF